MKNRYNVEIRIENEYFFNIESSESIVSKVVTFSLVDVDNLFYILSLGSTTDINSSVVDFETLTGNGDIFRVLNSVAWAVEDFLTKNPDAKIIFEGNIEKKTRVYVKLISRKLELVEKEYKLYGIIDGEVYPFEINQPYQAIVVSKKS